MDVDWSSDSLWFNSWQGQEILSSPKMPKPALGLIQRSIEWVPWPPIEWVPWAPIEWVLWAPIEWVPWAPIEWVPWAPPMAVKWPGPEADH